MNLNAHVMTMPKRQLNTPQQAFLHEAMQRLGMDIDQFAARLRAPRSRIESWLANPGDAGFQELDPVIWTLVREISPIPHTPVLTTLLPRPPRPGGQIMRFTPTQALAS